MKDGMTVILRDHQECSVYHLSNLTIILTCHRFKGSDDYLRTKVNETYSHTVIFY